MAGTAEPLDSNYKPVLAGIIPGVGFAVPLMGTATTTDSVTGQAVGPLAHTLVDGYKTSYSAAVNGFASVASATDIFAITGSATKTVRITHIEVSGIATTILDTTVRILIRTTANTLGTPTTVPAIPHDQNNAAATAVVQTYAANPTVNDGTTRIVRSSKVLFNLAAPTAASESGRLILDFGNRPSQGIVLRGVAQQLTINLNGVTVAGPSIDISCEFTEE